MAIFCFTELEIGIFALVVFSLGFVTNVFLNMSVKKALDSGEKKQTEKTSVNKENKVANVTNGEGNAERSDECEKTSGSKLQKAFVNQRETVKCEHTSEDEGWLEVNSKADKSKKIK